MRIYSGKLEISTAESRKAVEILLNASRLFDGDEGEDARDVASLFRLLTEFSEKAGDELVKIESEDVIIVNRIAALAIAQPENVANRIKDREGAYDPDQFNEGLGVVRAIREVTKGEFPDQLA